MQGRLLHADPATLVSLVRAPSDVGVFSSISGQANRQMVVPFPRRDGHENAIAVDNAAPKANAANFGTNFLRTSDAPRAEREIRQQPPLLRCDTIGEAQLAHVTVNLAFLALLRGVTAGMQFLVEFRRCHGGVLLRLLLWLRG